MNHFKVYLIKCLYSILIVTIFCCTYLSLCGFSKDVKSAKATQSSAKSISQKSTDEISVIMVGDILLHDGVEQSSKMKDGSYDFSHIFVNTKEEIEGADVAIVNQEVIIGGKELRVTGYPSFNAPYEIADELYNVGFDVVLHATNHALDRGKKGIVNCLNYWEKNYPSMKIAGIYDSKEDAEDICVVEKNGVKIAILNYTYGTNGISLPKGMPYAVALLSEETVIRDLEKAEAECDFTLVCPHWGTEYSLDASKQQKKWAKVFADNGADLIIGTHPHVIEPIEMVESEDGRKVPVYYSIGNFVNFTGESGKGVGNRMVGGMAKVTLSIVDNTSSNYGRNDSENVRVKKCSVIPLVCHVESKVNGVTTYYMKDYGPKLASRNEVGKRDSDFSYEYCNELVDRIWGKKYIE